MLGLAAYGYNTLFVGITAIAFCGLLIIKHYQRLSDREAFVIAEMVRKAFYGIGTEYETLPGAFDKDLAAFIRECHKWSDITLLAP